MIGDGIIAEPVALGIGRRHRIGRHTGGGRDTVRLQGHAADAVAVDQAAGRICQTRRLPVGLVQAVGGNDQRRRVHRQRPRIIGDRIVAQPAALGVGRRHTVAAQPGRRRSAVGLQGDAADGIAINKAVGRVGQIGRLPIGLVQAIGRDGQGCRVHRQDRRDCRKIEGDIVIGEAVALSCRPADRVAAHRGAGGGTVGLQADAVHAVAIDQATHRKGGARRLSVELLQTIGGYDQGRRVHRQDRRGGRKIEGNIVIGEAVSQSRRPADRVTAHRGGGGGTVGLDGNTAHTVMIFQTGGNEAGGFHLTVGLGQAADIDEQICWRYR